MKRFLIASFLATLSALSVSAAEFEPSVEVTQEVEVKELKDGVAPAVVDYVPTSTFSVKIPKAIKLDENGHGNYTVGVKGKISSSTVVKIEPSRTIEMESFSEDGSRVEAKVNPGKELWKYDEVSENEWSEDSTGEIQMEEVGFGSEVLFLLTLVFCNLKRTELITTLMVGRTMRTILLPGQS